MPPKKFICSQGNYNINILFLLFKNKFNNADFLIKNNTKDKQKIKKEGAITFTS
jgi:hypothetical protein